MAALRGQRLGKIGSAEGCGEDRHAETSGFGLSSRGEVPIDDRNAASTKGDLADLETRLTEAIRDSQTEVLRAIYGYTETIQTHLKDLDRSETGLR
jgi:hypothetical protein